ncbi:hypothetical protein RYX36_021345, partial [Vicia faba]
NEMKMMKDARVNINVAVNFIGEYEIETYAGDVGVNNKYEVETPFNVDVDIVESQSKHSSNMATRMKNQPRKRGKKTRLNL